MTEDCMGCGKPLSMEESDTFPYCHKCDKSSEELDEELFKLYDKQLAGEWN